MRYLTDIMAFKRVRTLQPLSPGLYTNIAAQLILPAKNKIAVLTSLINADESGAVSLDACFRVMLIKARLTSIKVT